MNGWKYAFGLKLTLWIWWWLRPVARCWWRQSVANRVLSAVSMSAFMAAAVAILN